MEWPLGNKQFLFWLNVEIPEELLGIKMLLLPDVFVSVLFQFQLFALIIFDPFLFFQIHVILFPFAKVVGMFFAQAPILQVAVGNKLKALEIGVDETAIELVMDRKEEFRLVHRVFFNNFIVLCYFFPVLPAFLNIVDDVRDEVRMLGALSCVFTFCTTYLLLQVAAFQQVDLYLASILLRHLEVNHLVQVVQALELQIQLLPLHVVLYFDGFLEPFKGCLDLQRHFGVVQARLVCVIILVILVELLVFCRSVSSPFLFEQFQYFDHFHKFIEYAFVACLLLNLLVDLAFVLLFHFLVLLLHFFYFIFFCFHFIACVFGSVPHLLPELHKCFYLVLPVLFAVELSLFAGLDDLTIYLVSFEGLSHQVHGLPHPWLTKRKVDVSFSWFLPDPFGLILFQKWILIVHVDNQHIFRDFVSFLF